MLKRRNQPSLNELDRNSVQFGRRRVLSLRSKLRDEHVDDRGSGSVTRRDTGAERARDAHQQFIMNVAGGGGISDDGITAAGRCGLRRGDGALGMKTSSAR